MGKRHSSRQDVLLLTETSDMVDGRFNSEEGSRHVASPDSLQAWELDFSQQFKDPKSGRFVQVISDRSKKPLKVFKLRSELSGQSTDVIASQKQDEELAFLNTYHEKNKMIVWVGIIAALFAVVISVVVLLIMQNRNDPQIVLLPSIGMALAAAPIAAIKGNGKREIKDDEALKHLAVADTTELINCKVIVEKTGKGYDREIARPLIPGDSLERKYHGRPFHLLGLDLEGNLWAIEPDNTIKKNDSPKDCFIALQCEKEVTAIYSIGEGWVEKVKIGLFIGLCIVELIILFLIITAASGGSV